MNVCEGYLVPEPDLHYSHIRVQGERLARIPDEEGVVSKRQVDVSGLWFNLGPRDTLAPILLVCNIKLQATPWSGNSVYVLGNLAYAGFLPRISRPLQDRFCVCVCVVVW